MTRSPAATNCWASNDPVPVAPSIAHARGVIPARPVQQPLSLMTVRRQLERRLHAFLGGRSRPPRATRDADRSR